MTNPAPTVKQKPAGWPLRLPDDDYIAREYVFLGPLENLVEDLDYRIRWEVELRARAELPRVCY